MYCKRRIHDRGWFVQCNNHNSLLLLLPLKETRITIFYEYQTGNCIYVVHGNELVKMSAKVTNNIHYMARSTLLLGNEVGYNLCFLTFQGVLKSWHIFIYSF